MESIDLINSKPYSLLAITKGLNTWGELINYFKLLPYGRNSNRADLSLVLKEDKGSCSSKQALLKLIADENNFTEVKLILAIYKMNGKNTPGINSVLSETKLEFIPEAHCFLQIGKSYLDVTNSNSSYDKFVKDIIIEKEIIPSQVINYKIDFHKNFLKKWIKDENIKFSFQEIWLIREKCIKALSLT